MVARYNAVMVNYNQDLSFGVNLRIVSESSANASPNYMYVNVSTEEEAKKLKEDIEGIVLEEFKESFDKISELTQHIKVLQREAKELLGTIKEECPAFIRKNYHEIIL